MKILHIIYSLSFGGAERFVVDLCNTLSESSENNIVLVSICDSNDFRFSQLLPFLSTSVRFVNLNSPKGLSVKSLFSLFLLIRNEQPDIVHCHSNLILLYLPQFFLRGHFVHTLHSTASHCIGFNWLKLINRYCYSHSVQPVTISPESSVSFRSLYGLSNDILILNGRVPLFRSAVKPSLMNSFSDGYTFIHVANNTKPKNHDRLFRLFLRLQAECVPFNLICIGKDYEKYIQRLSANPQIHFLGQTPDVSQYLSYSDFYILSSDYEGMPISLLEAMSLGVVPISTPAGGVINVIRDGQNGYLSEGFDDDLLYQKVRQAITEYGKISRDALIGEFNQNYSIEICASRYAEIYRNILS